MILVTGSTGNIGTELAEKLLADGQPVRLLVRDADKVAHWQTKAEIVVADLDKPETLDEAFSGIHSVFLLVTDHDSTQTRYALAAAKQHGIKYMVYLSSMGAGLVPPLKMDEHHVQDEQLIKDSGIDYTIIRASFLMSNSLMWADTIRQDATVHDGFGSGIQMAVDPRDVAAVAAILLEHPDDHIGKSYELTGSERLTTQHMVETLAATLGRSLQYIEHTPKESADMLATMGMPEQFARQLQESMERTRNGEADIVTDTVQELTDHAPQTYREWVQAHAQYFI